MEHVSLKANLSYLNSKNIIRSCMTNMITLHDEISGYADEACLLDGEYLMK